ncbi:MAG: hypothetical protein Q8Q28_08690 [Pseudomonadota bacterium]|nr:hypothetical protein [Pseudomonadota bacterium]
MPTNDKDFKAKLGTLPIAVGRKSGLIAPSAGIVGRRRHEDAGFSDLRRYQMDIPVVGLTELIAEHIPDQTKSEGA